MLQIVRELKDIGVEVRFEKENINTLDGKGEVLISILASLAQDESRSISENSTWGIRRKFEQGKVVVNHNKFLGYDKDEEGNLIINKEMWEAVQLEMERRRAFAEKYNISKLDYATVYNPFAGRVICGHCGSTFNAMIEKMTVFEGEKIIVTLLDGTEIEVVIE